MNGSPIRVQLAGGEYAIHVDAGLLQRAGKILRPLLPGDRIAVVADAQAAELHLAKLIGSLEAAGFEAIPVSVEPGETSKSIDEYARLMDRLLDLRLGRDGAIAAFGGGVIGDLAGFAAATLYRGVRLVQVPTTLLAQVDSAIGGKTGVNARQGKNLVGAFHQPVCVLADTRVLETLPVREMRAGYAEIVKTAALGDAAFFGWLEEHGAGVLAHEPRAVLRAVAETAAAKAAIVADDETEEGRRALLNLGHTFGHALEAADAYAGRFVHGEAVAVGMVLAAELSERLGFCGPQVPARLRTHLAALGLPVAPAALGHGFTPEQLLEKMAQDKKFRSGRPTFVLLRAIGEACVCSDPDMEVVRALLRDSCATPG